MRSSDTEKCERQSVQSTDHFSCYAWLAEGNLSDGTERFADIHH